MLIGADVRCFGFEVLPDHVVVIFHSLRNIRATAITRFVFNKIHSLKKSDRIRNEWIQCVKKQISFLTAWQGAHCPQHFYCSSNNRNCISDLCRINYFVIMTRPLHPIQGRKRSSSSCYDRNIGLFFELYAIRNQHRISLTKSWFWTKSWTN